MIYYNTALETLKEINVNIKVPHAKKLDLDDESIEDVRLEVLKVFLEY